MIRSLIIARDERGLIGAGGALPWRIPEELAHFRRVTIGAGNNAVIMGRRTRESIGRRLELRLNIVLTRGDIARWRVPAASLAQAFAVAETARLDEAIVIGGASVYAEALGYVDRCYVTRIHHAYDAAGGVYAPAALDALPHAVVASERHEADGGCSAWTAEEWRVLR